VNAVKEEANPGNNIVENKTENETLQAVRKISSVVHEVSQTLKKE
jgi:hypothetical protein